MQIGRHDDNPCRSTGEPKMTTPNQCQFWDCKETIRRNYFLCSPHYSRYEAGMIDQCKSCGQYKDAKDDVCLNCYGQTASAWASSRYNATNGGDERVPPSAMTTPNECRFWSCTETIRTGHYLCLNHFIQERQGRINRCRSCTNYKAMRFSQCFKCHQPNEIHEENIPAADIPDNHSTTEFSCTF